MTERDKSQEHDLASIAARNSRLGSLILDLWQRTRIDWAFVNERLGQAFRKERRLGSRERRFAAETVYGMVRHLRRIDAALQAGGLRPGSQAADRDRLLAYLVLEAGLTPRDAARHRPGIDWGNVADIDARLAAEPNAGKRIALCHSLPDWLGRALVADLGERAEAFAAALNRRAPTTIRVNTLRCSRDELAEELARGGLVTTPGRYSATALHVDTRTNLSGLKSFSRGKFEAQDEGSQLIAELVSPPARARVVDYCAGAGGKTLAMAALMGNRGRIVATDIDRRKLEKLRRRARRAGVTTVQSAVLADGFAGALDGLEGRVERVLVDAPCSGLGALRRNPEMRWRLRPADLEELPATQFAICSQAMSLVAPGGRLIYATCTVLERENQGVVDRLIAAHPGFAKLPVRAIWPDARGLTDPGGEYLWLGPDEHGTDGFFAAVLEKSPEVA